MSCIFDCFNSNGSNSIEVKAGPSKPSNACLTDKQKSMTLLVGGIIALLGGVILMFASLNIFSSTLTALSTAHIAGIVISSVMMVGGGIALTYGVQKSQVSKLHASDTVNDYDFHTLKSIADRLIMDVYARNLIGAPYRVKTDPNLDTGGSVAPSVYPTSSEELKEYEAAVPQIVKSVRDEVEQRLHRAVFISELLDVLHKEHQLLFPYIY